ncbi:MAG TPA: LptF/LptG family permease [Gemmatimonadales bacterium]|nr:LptF/LptG family permease [Gemmatimonadales bacterium]
MRLFPRLRVLDRYVLTMWGRIFVLTALGFPLVEVVIDLADRFDKLSRLGLGSREILLSYAYAIPGFAFEVLPAAVLFATVFTIGTLSRNTELTAAKASGVSFHRILAPILVAAALTVGLGLVLGEVAPGATARSLELQKDKAAPARVSKYNFVYRADEGWVYTIRALDLRTRALRGLLFERQGTGADFPTLAVTADSATWDSAGRHWRLWGGTSRVIAAAGTEEAWNYRTARLRVMREPPTELVLEAKKPDEMRYAELGRYIAALKRAGNDATKLEVDQAIKIVLPVTCFIIAIFGAPMALTAPRSGTAMGIAIGLATTVIFLTMVELSRAIGITGVVPPLVAAWFPSALFLTIGGVLLVRARS